MKRNILVKLQEPVRKKCSIVHSIKHFRKSNNLFQVFLQAKHAKIAWHVKISTSHTNPFHINTSASNEHMKISLQFFHLQKYGNTHTQRIIVCIRISSAAKPNRLKSKTKESHYEPNGMKMKSALRWKETAIQEGKSSISSELPWHAARQHIVTNLFSLKQIVWSS